jgi:hypothetical protein
MHVSEAPGNSYNRDYRNADAGWRTPTTTE